MFAWLGMLPIFFQSILVNSTQPCFMNKTAGVDMFKNCGMGGDWLQSVLIGWEWITGGYFTFVLVSVIVLIIYIKYEKMIYAVFFGAVFLPISFFVFPVALLSAIAIIGLVGLGLLLAWVVVSQTNEG